MSTKPKPAKKLFKVTVAPCVDYGTVVVEANTKEEVAEIVDELFEDDPDVFDWPSSDISGTDCVRVIKIEEVKHGNEKNKNN